MEVAGAMFHSCDDVCRRAPPPPDVKLLSTSAIVSRGYSFSLSGLRDQSLMYHTTYNKETRIFQYVYDDELKSLNFGIATSPSVQHVSSLTSACDLASPLGWFTDLDIFNNNKISGGDKCRGLNISDGYDIYLDSVTR